MKNKIIVAGILVGAWLCGNVQGETTNVFESILVQKKILQSTTSFANLYYSTALGYGTRAGGVHSLAEGKYTIATGSYSHAEGLSSIAAGYVSHAEGNTTEAYGSASHAEGYLTEATGHYSHAEGNLSSAIGTASHAEGYSNIAYGAYSHAEGRMTDAGGVASHAEGDSTVADAKNSHAGGVYSEALAEHTNSFIHATGTFGAVKETEHADTAHFDHLVTLEPALVGVTNAILNRQENDELYATLSQGNLAATALQPNTAITVETVSATSSILVPEQGDIAMGSFTNGVQP